MEINLQSAGARRMREAKPLVWAMISLLEGLTGMMQQSAGNLLLTAHPQSLLEIKPNVVARQIARGNHIVELDFCPL